MLAALAAGREVIVSRGELVEIGGGFRVPDVMAQSGAVLREVGTTNRTRAADYAAAIGDRTALILRVHPSNFRIEGFTERPALDELVALGRRFNMPVVEDLGSGWLGGRPSTIARRARATSRSSPRQHRAPASTSCCFSGDKLLGGPQAGIIAGRQRGCSTRIRRHPLMRALRVDKMTYAALEATLEEYAAGRAATTVPVARMLALDADDDPPARRGAGRRAARQPDGATRRRHLRGRRRQRAGVGAADRAGRDTPRVDAGDALEERLRGVESPGHRAHPGSACRAGSPHGAADRTPGCSQILSGAVDSATDCITAPIDRASGATCCRAKPAAKAKTTSTSAGIHVLLITVVSQ